MHRHWIQCLPTTSKQWTSTVANHILVFCQLCPSLNLLYMLVHARSTSASIDMFLELDCFRSQAKAWPRRSHDKLPWRTFGGCSVARWSRAGNGQFRIYMLNDEISWDGVRESVNIQANISYWACGSSPAGCCVVLEKNLVCLDVCLWVRHLRY